MTIVINLYGGPGTGKSTSAAYLFHKLKVMGYNAELVTEYVKEWAWEQRNISNFDQLYFLGKQTRRESMLYGKVDYIVTDSPVMLSMHYAKANMPDKMSTAINDVVYAYYDMANKAGHRHIHVMLKRTKPYTQSGRFQSLEQAVDIDRDIMKIIREARKAKGFSNDMFMTSDVDTMALDTTLIRILG